MKSAFNWKVAGAAGEGIKSTGLILSKTCLRSNLYTFDYTEYPSLIRGGHNTYQVHASLQPVYSQVRDIDVLVALNKNALTLHVNELTPESIIIYDGKDINVDISVLHIPGELFDVPLVELAKSVGAERVMANNVALGVSASLVSLDIRVLKNVIADTFKGKSDQIISLNQQSAQAGFDYAQKQLPKKFAFPKKPIPDNLTLSGNEALSLGAIAGGMKAYIAYPMTPSSSILHTLAEWQPKTNIFVKHAEDEIGVINMAIGMSYTGVPAACGTSGGGFCYMTEAVGLSGVAEIPLVIFESQRPGPALGMPTWTAQADLLFTISASQDEFPRIVLAPGDVSEAFDSSKMAFSLADEYQIPVIVLSDKHLSESNQSFHIDQTQYAFTSQNLNSNPRTDENGFFTRYRLTDSGVSPRTVPGIQNGYYLCNSYEHDVYGLSSETAEDRQQQMDKRFKKFRSIQKHIPKQYYVTQEQAQITLISWGSTKGPIRQAITQLNNEGIYANHLNLSWVWPFPVEQVTSVLQSAVNPIIVEGNKTYQMAQLIRQHTGLDIYHKRNKYDGRPFYPHEIISWVKEIL